MKFGPDPYFERVRPGDWFTVNFKWSDNMQADGDIMDFCTNGDVAPGARYKYSFTTVGAKTPETETETDGETTVRPESETNPPADTEIETPTCTEPSTGCASALGVLMLPVLLLIVPILRKREE